MSRQYFKLQYLVVVLRMRVVTYERQYHCDLKIWLVISSVASWITNSLQHYHGGDNTLFQPTLLITGMNSLEGESRLTITQLDVTLPLNAQAVEVNVDFVSSYDYA